jgi:hypothetical protein
MFFMEQEGDTPTNYILKISRKRVYNNRSRNKERAKENEKNYNAMSIHEDISGCHLGFALSITRANSVLNLSRTD